MSVIKQNIVGLNFEELKELVVSLDEKPFRAKQLWSWIYKNGIDSFDKMHNLPANLLSKLDEKYCVQNGIISKELISFDETRKWLIKFADGNEIEAVYIPEKDRGTLCISSQVGCTLTCKFCHTGTQKLVRNLTAGEIIAQLRIAKESLNDWPADKENRKLTNIVMMGMGEPLLNYKEVSKALKIIMDEDGINMSKRKITLSTSGLVPEIYECGNDLGVNLAVSLHATRDELRNEIVPINRKYKIKELLEACRNYPAVSNRTKITFEYVMLKDVNDSDTDARELVKLIKGIPSKINLIPFNPWPGSIYECSSKKRIEAFARIVEKAGYMSPVRKPRGQDILAACGQLKSESERTNRKAA